MSKNNKQTNKMTIKILLTLAVVWQLVWLFVFSWTSFDATYGMSVLLAILSIGSLGIAAVLVNYKQVQPSISSQASAVILAVLILGVSYFLYTILAVLNGLLD